MDSLRKLLDSQCVQYVRMVSIAIIFKTLLHLLNVKSNQFVLLVHKGNLFVHQALIRIKMDSIA